MAWAPDYATVNELGNYLVSGGIGDTDDDVQLALALTAASRAIDYSCNRQFGKTALEERFYVVCPDYYTGYWTVGIDDLQTVVGLVVEVDGTPVTVFDLVPLNAAVEGRPWTELSFTADSEVTPSRGDRVAITATWGWTAVPDTIKQATLLQAGRIFTRRNAPFGVAGSPEMGSELRLLAKVDPDVEVMLASYKRMRSPG